MLDMNAKQSHEMLPSRCMTESFRRVGLFVMIDTSECEGLIRNFSFTMRHIYFSVVETFSMPDMEAKRAHTMLPFFHKKRVFQHIFSSSKPFNRRCFQYQEMTAKNAHPMFPLHIRRVRFSMLHHIHKAIRDPGCLKI